MSTATIQFQSITYKIGWWLLLGLVVVGVLGYVAMIFVEPLHADSFVAWATLSFCYGVVLLIPYRRREKWAWCLTWVAVIPAIVLSVANRDLAPWYLPGVGLGALGQLLTLRAFFSRGSLPDSALNR